MTPERWQQVKAIFDQAVECDPAIRFTFVRTSCAGDEQLQREVELLLTSDQEAGSLLEHSILPGPTRPLFREPKEIGNYILGAEIAHGGMGIVYRARHVSLPRDVVVKCIRPVMFSEHAHTELRIRFRREAYIQSQLNHPHIVRVYEFFADTEEYFLVMEYVHGSSLRAMLDKERVLPVQQAVALTVQALDGLGYAHTLPFVDESGNTGVGLIHRDIKPANLLVDEHGNLKITDFGIVKLLGASKSTKTGVISGTVEYISPEHLRGEPIDGRSDLYSLGITLYEALCGRVPFQRSLADSDYAILKGHIEIEPPPVESLNPEIPFSLAHVVKRSLKKDPRQRWQTAAEFRDALLSHQKSPITIATGPPGRTGESRVIRQPAWPIPARIAIVVLAFLLILAAVWFRWGRSDFRSRQDRPSIAVLPFADLSPNNDQQYFSEGLAEELLNALSRVPELRVAARTSSFRFGGKADDSRNIGRALNVQTLLAGSVRKQGNRARIAANLIKASDGFQLWSDTYERDLTDIFAVQEEIARAVMGALKVKLLGQKAAAPSSQSTNAEAYNAYLQGRYFFGRRNKENLAKAANFFEQATKLDPGYAPAWIGLAASRTNQAGTGYIPVEQGYRSAKQAAERALALKPDQADAYVVLGAIQMGYYGDWAAADSYYKRALALEPGNARVISGAALLAMFQGRQSEAIRLYRRTIESDPLSSGVYKNLGISLYYAGQQEEAAATFKKSLELFPEMALAHSLMGRVYLAQSRPQDALAEMKKEQDPEFYLFGLALAHHALGHKQESDANLAELIAKFRAQAPYEIAEVYAFRGEKDRAFEWLDRAYAERDTGLREIKGDPLLKSLENDPRYTALLTKLHLPL